MGNRIKVAAIQMNCLMTGKEDNLKLAADLIERAGQAGAKIIVLPELFSTAYRVEERDYALSEPIPGPTTDWMQSWCKKYDAYLMGAIIERGDVDGVLYDTAVLVGPQGVIGKYRKIFLWGPEALRFSRGTEYPVFDLGFAKVGMQICYEVGFPEGARFLGLQGADILLYTAAFGLKRVYAWDIATRARALENGAFLIAADRSGIEKGETDFAAKSRIVDPQGTVLAEAQEDNDVIVSEIDLGQIAPQRMGLPYLRDYNRTLIARQFAK